MPCQPQIQVTPPTEDIEIPYEAPLLPTHTPSSPPNFVWGSLDGEQFATLLDTTYTKVVHWRRNCFSVPFSNVGKDFVNELSRLYLAYGSASALETVALKATIVLPILLLQKPSKRSKTKDHIKCVQRRMVQWRNGDLEELMKEGMALQSRLPRDRPNRPRDSLASSFANLMFKGKCKAALDLLSNEEKGGILHLKDPADSNDPTSPTVKECLMSKHPQGRQAQLNCILEDEPQDQHPILFESIDGSVIRSAAIKVSGAAGPSGLDAHEWRRLCTSHKEASRDLCNSLAAVARRICSSYVDPTHIKPLLASRLIALDKNPGVRPIGIGDTARRIIAKAVLTIISTDIQEATGCRQMCGGQISGIEAAVHAARSAFESTKAEAILLVDATNAFNALNRKVALQNMRRLCPPIATILINSYRNTTELFVDGEVILSQEGTTQGDPLAMPMYGLATIPLIKKLDGLCKQVWYADDSAAIGTIEQLHDWWNKLAAVGPAFGYFPNSSKTWLVTKQNHLDRANNIFAGSGVNITPEGRPYLGAAIGSRKYIDEYVNTKVRLWSSSINTLSNIAKSQPHAAYSAITHGVLSKWTYLSRVVPNISHLLVPLDDALRINLIPAITGRPPPNNAECDLYALPARLGGLGIRTPSKLADKEVHHSLKITSSLTDRILDQDNEYGYNTVRDQLLKRAEVSKDNRKRLEEEAASLHQQLPDWLQKAVELSKTKGASTWLTVLPLTEHGFTLHKSAFHDALALRYGWTPTRLPLKCDCGKNFNVEHALSCAKGGFPTLRHNEIRDTTASLLTEVCSEVCVEPNLQPVSPDQLNSASANSQDNARLDISANGVWGSRFQKTYFDVRVFNPLAPSNRNQSQAATFRKHEMEKKRAYQQRIQDVEHSSFTPLVLSVTGGMGVEATLFYKRLSSLLAQKWDTTYSKTLCWLRCRLTFSLLRSAIQAIRGARSSVGHTARSPIAIDLISAESHLTMNGQ